MGTAWDVVTSGLAGFLCFGALLSYFDVMIKLKKSQPLGSDRAMSIRLPAFYRLDVIVLGFYTFTNGMGLIGADRDWHDWWVTGLGGLGFAVIFAVWIVSHDASRATKLEIRGRAAQHVKKGRKPEWLPMK